MPTVSFDLEPVLRYVAPPLAAIVLALQNFELMRNVEVSDGMKFVGTLTAAFWLTAVGPRDLVRSGGIMMRTLKIPATPMRVTYFGILWIVLAIVFAFLVGIIAENYRLPKDNASLASISADIFGAFFYGCLMAGLGVFAFLAYERAFQTPDGNNGENTLTKHNP